MMVFSGVLLALVLVDGRVRDRLSDLFTGGESAHSIGDRLVELFDAVTGALQVQAVDNGLLLVFTAVGAVLFLFMLKT